jgi:predicted GH43/DUF377 family glycosyl hydrolase
VTIDRLASRLAIRLRPDPSRVITQLFVPGHDVPIHEGRPSGVVGRILALGDDEVEVALAAIMARFGRRHRDLPTVFRRHADRIGNRLEPGTALSEERCLLLGATFTHEYSVEAAALCNPSAVPAPDQSGTPPGALRFVMSVRQIGEGHRSSIGFRTGFLAANGAVTIDEPSPFTTPGRVETSMLDAESFRGSAARIHDHTHATAWVLDRLGDHFSVSELDDRLAQLEAQQDTRRNVVETVRSIRELAGRTYTVRFPAASELGERVLLPATAVESNGVEDARFTRFVDPDGDVTYYATYTGYDGSGVVQQLLTTDDFLTFTSSPLLGDAAADKGMVLFPRQIEGRFAALSRHDGATNAVAFSDDITRWSSAVPFESAAAPWEAIQVGNCGAPIETEQGWLVLTHGVGPMRTYAIGACLLDLRDPSKLLAKLAEPLLSPQPDEQDGYVPNVVYSCGALVHDRTMLIPYGISDATIGFATVDVDQLLLAMGAA